MYKNNYDYLEAVTADVKEYISDNGILETPLADPEHSNPKTLGFENLVNAIYDSAVNEDSVTGNASGSYFMNTFEAENALCHNWGLIKLVVDEFELEYPETCNPETLDVHIRIYFLRQAIEQALEELGIEH